MAKTPVAWPPGRYRLTEKSYIGRVPGAMQEVLEADTEIVYDGLPGPHMIGVDDQAKANIAHAAKVRGAQNLDPTMELSLVVGEVDDVDAEIAATKLRLDTLVAQRRQAAVAGQATTAHIEPAAPVAAPAAPAAAPMPHLPAPMRHAPPPPL